MPEQVELGETALSAVGGHGAGARLFTATIRLRDGDGVVEILHACRVRDGREVTARLAKRVGSGLAAAATVRAGVDPSDPVVLALLPAGIALSLDRDGDLPGRALACGGDLHIVQRRG